MKVRQIIDIMIKNNEFGEKIRFHYDRLSTLNYLKMDGKLMDFATANNFINNYTNK